MLTASLSRAGGGIYEIVRRLSQSLAERVAVEVLGLTDQFTQADFKTWHPLEPKAFAGIPRSYGFSPGLTTALREAHSDIAHVHGLWMYPSLAASRWAHHAHRPYIVTVHGMMEPWALANARWKKNLAGLLFENRVLRNASCLHVNTEQELANVRAWGLRNPVCVIPNGIDLPARPPAISPPWQGKFASGDHVLLFLGRLHPKKGLANLLEAWGDLRQAQPGPSRNWKLAIVGWDQLGHEAQLKEIVRRRNLDSCVDFLGPQVGESKAAAYYHADAFVLPSFSEGLPMAALEAWAFAKPVLLTPQCNFPSSMVAQAGINIDPTRPSIAAGLQSLFTMTLSERTKLGQRGRQVVAEHFTWNRVASDLLEVYQWLLGHQDHPICLRTEPDASSPSPFTAAAAQRGRREAA